MSGSRIRKLHDPAMPKFFIHERKNTRWDKFVILSHKESKICSDIWLSSFNLISRNEAKEKYSHSDDWDELNWQGEPNSESFLS